MCQLLLSGKDIRQAGFFTSPIFTCTEVFAVSVPCICCLAARVSVTPGREGAGLLEPLGSNWQRNRFQDEAAIKRV